MSHAMMENRHWTSPRMVGAPQDRIMPVRRSADGTQEVHAGIQGFSGSFGQ
jgi:hypothetical protein